ncbi:hypothetical protein HMPREF1552_00270 [Leptotrichia sp. oral taxon 879 str. F0557]|nr:hypothetical protein HMPREF1552_00270 [Leptotrichia sp. oral taxon 879 str. F0557]
MLQFYSLFFKSFLFAKIKKLIKIKNRNYNLSFKEKWEKNQKN